MATKRDKLLLLTTTTGYQTRAYVAAAEKLGLEVVFGSDRCHRLDDPWRDHAIPLKFYRPEQAAARVVEYARAEKVAAIVPIGDRPTPVAGRACAALGMPAHPPEAADVCRDKHRMRQRMREAGLLMPRFERFTLDNDPRAIFSDASAFPGFPCVLKPLALSASRGVIRANNEAEAVRAFERIRALLTAPDIKVLREEASEFIQVEEYIPGVEVALEAVMDRGRLHPLALFDKPEPMEGPHFEETIYTTPSRLAPAQQTAILRTAEKCVQALGLYHGPLHAEFRVNERPGERPVSAGSREPGARAEPLAGGALEVSVWPLEVAARPIGGLCARALRFQLPLVEEEMSLEEVVIRLAMGMDTRRVVREERAAGVMMIPIPGEGFYEGVEGLEEARAVAGVEAIEITAKLRRKLVPLPEGASYLGFIFARGATPELVEHALREAHGRLRFRLSPALPIIRA